MHATLGGHAEAVQLLLELQADPALVSGEGHTALMLAVAQKCSSSSLAVVRALVDCGVGIDTPGPDHRTALHTACALGHLPYAEHLLRVGADPDVRDSSGKTAYHAAGAAGLKDLQTGIRVRSKLSDAELQEQEVSAAVV